MQEDHCNMLGDPHTTDVPEVVNPNVVVQFEIPFS
jgi:hypothetical protein